MAALPSGQKSGKPRLSYASWHALAAHPEMPPISAFIITYNNAHEIERCLQSIAWVDEIVCVDSLSHDGTQEVCRRYGARVVEQPFLGYYQQLQFAEGLCTHDWALNLYADETLSLPLQARLQAIFHGEPDREPDADAFETPRRTFLHKRFIPSAGYYPSWHLRVFRRSQGGHVPRNPHQKIKVKGRVRKLREPLDHWCWRQNGEILDNLVEYARIEAEEMTQKGERATFFSFTVPLMWEFLKRYIFRGGFRQGTLGLIMCLRPVAERTIRLIFAWELQNNHWLETPDRAWRSAQDGNGRRPAPGAENGSGPGDVPSAVDSAPKADGTGIGTDTAAGPDAR